MNFLSTVNGRVVLARGIFGVLLAVSAAGAEKPPEGGGAKLTIRPLDEKAWKCGIADVEKVLYSSAGELWRYFPERQLPVIEVRAKGGPIVLYERGPKGEIRVRLDTGENLWAQMAYQFAHEFTHILCCYDEKHRETKWFEESLCELASLFALHRMAETWKTRPPYSNWKSYAPSLAKYADERIAKAKLPEGKTLAQWYAENAEALRKDATDRPRNCIVAGVLLPLFENQPEAWAAVEYLNTEPFPGPYTFAEYLKAWQGHSPEKLRPFVARIGKEFGVELPGAEGK
jgi:hypothetical protein